MTRLSSLDFNTVVIADHTGYGNASRYLESALDQKIDIFKKSDTILNFCMPKDYKFRRYTIGYTPWESTEIPISWIDPLRRVDDLWATSKWVANLFKSKTGRQDIFVLPHGITDNWHPVQHKYDTKPFTFLHLGEPAVRKGGDLVLEAWYKHFRFRKDVQIIYKCIGHTMARVKDREGSIVYSPPMIENGKIIDAVYSELELWRLFVESNCLVYPSRGEGFGLIPLEAMASGLPTILPLEGGTGDFARYGIPLKERMWVSSNQPEHPGLWMDHNLDELIHLMEHTIHNYESEAIRSYNNAWDLKNMFCWETIAIDAIERIESKMVQ